MTNNVPDGFMLVVLVFRDSSLLDYSQVLLLVLDIGCPCVRTVCVTLRGARKHRSHARERVDAEVLRKLHVRLATDLEVGAQIRPQG